MLVVRLPEEELGARRWPTSSKEKSPKINYFETLMFVVDDGCWASRLNHDDASESDVTIHFMSCAVLGAGRLDGEALDPLGRSRKLC
jgi:hypothetical protein